MRPSFGQLGERSSSKHRGTVIASMISAAQSRMAGPMAMTKRGSLKSLGVVSKASGRPKQPRVPPRFGLLAPDDPFFWFCHQNFLVYTYPAQNLPRHLLSDGVALTCQYSDFTSRTATPEPRGDAADGGRPGRSEMPAPPSICLCQPTELSGHVRQRWPVRKEFVDEQQLILGDTGWFPGALGQRFTFEAKTDTAERYVRLNLVPQAQLLYLEHLRLPSTAKAKHRSREGHSQEPARRARFDAAVSSSSSSESSAEDENAGLTLRRGRGSRRRPLGRSASRPTAAGEQRAGSLGADETTNLMLPPLLPTKAG